MAISQVSPNSVATNPSYTNPYAKTDQQTVTSQASQNAQKTSQVAKTDTVTISQQALQKTNGAQTNSGQSGQQTAQASTYQYPGIK